MRDPDAERLWSFLFRKSANFLVREAGLEPARPKTQVPKTCVSAIPPLPLAVLG
jgi:hypothetical protein